MKRIRFFLAAALAAAVLLHPQASVSAAQQAMRLWYSSVAPALFPFLALMPLLTGPEACAVYERIFSRFMRTVFRLPGSAAPAMIIALISGSPGGAIALSRMAGRSGMTKFQLRRLAPVICGVGPAYLIMGVGVGLCGSVETGVRLAAIQLSVQLILLLAMRFLEDDDPQTVGVVPMPENSGGIRSAVSSILTVCGYMVFFSVAAAAVSNLAGPRLGRLMLVAADLPSGMAALANCSFRGRQAVMGMAVGFGGLCIMAQNMDVLRPLGLGWKDMLGVKFAISALCGALSAVILPADPAAVPPAAAFNRMPYAFSLLAALILSLPLMISLSNKLFLNNRKGEDIFSSR